MAVIVVHGNVRDSRSRATSQVSHLSPDKIEFKKWTAFPLWATVSLPSSFKYKTI